MQAAALDSDHGAVSCPDDGQGGGIAFEEHQGGAFTTQGLPDRLSQRARGMQLRDQDDLVDIVRPEDSLELGRSGAISPRHPDGGDPVSAFGCTVPGAKNPCEHLIGRSAGAEGVAMVVDGDPGGVRTLDQHHTNRHGCHRHTENDVHEPLRYALLEPLNGSSPHTPVPLQPDLP